MTLSHISDQIGRSIKSFGVGRTLADVSMRALNRVVMLRIMRGIVIERGAAPGQPVDDPRYQFGRIDEDTLLTHARKGGYELSESFLRDAFARGDECYGFLNDGEIAAYTWYTSLPTPIELPGLTLLFKDRYVNIYKGFTHPAHRGHRLHSVGMAQALPIHVARGRQGQISYVELTHFAQRHSAMKAGFHYFGTLVITRLFGRYFLWASPGCAPYGFHFVQGPASARAPSGPAPRGAPALALH